MRNTRKFITGVAGILLVVVMVSPLVSASYWPNSGMGSADITWSGHGWWVADWGACSPSMVTIDSNGWLHCKQHASTDSEIITTDQEGYGTYTWVMQGIHQIDKNCVIGMNPYLSDSTASEQWREIDIEQSFWGSASGTNFDFWVQPSSQHVDQYFTQAYRNNDTTFIIDWEHTFDQFYILDTGSNQVLKSWNATATRDATGVYGVTNAWHYLNPTTTDTDAVFKSYSYQANHIYHLPTTTYPPVITSSPSLTVIAGSSYSYQPTATGSGTMTWTCSGRPSGMAINSGTGAISWTSAVLGDYPLVLTATNSYGSKTQSFTVHVSALVQPPAITSSPSIHAVMGTSYTYQLNGTNNPTWSCSGLPTGMTINGITGALTWLNPVAGNYSLVITATNSAGTDTQSFVLNVTGSAPNPDDDAAVIAHETNTNSYYYMDPTAGGHLRTDTKTTTISKWWYIGAAIVSVSVIVGVVMINNGGGKGSSHKKGRRRR